MACMGIRYFLSLLLALSVAFEILRDGLHIHSGLLSLTTFVLGSVFCLVARFVTYGGRGRSGPCYYIHALCL